MNKRRGFTLIEALAATALAAIMMTAVMTVISALAHDDSQAVNDSKRESWQQRMIELVEQDLRYSDSVLDQGDGVLMTGHLSLDQDTLKPTHRPVEVMYHTRKYADKSWLIRSQTDLESRALDNSWSEVVCSGVRAIKVMNAQQSTSSAANDENQADSLIDQAVAMDTAVVTIVWDTPEEDATMINLVIR